LGVTLRLGPRFGYFGDRIISRFSEEFRGAFPPHRPPSPARRNAKGW
jgi:hypothetical protein